MDKPKNSLTRANKYLLAFLLLLLFIVITTPTLIKKAPNFVLYPFLNSQTVENFIVVAHRGASKEAPENTISAFQKAVELGANGIECDVIFTVDDVPVIAHHNDLSDRVLPEQRPAIIDSMTLLEIKQLDVGAWFSKKFEGERIPTLKEGLEFLKGKVDRIYIHDKHENDYSGNKQNRIIVFAKIIKKSKMESSIVIMVEGGNLKLWQKLAPNIQLLKCWSGPNYQSKRFALEDSYKLGLKHFGVYHSNKQYSQLGKTVIQNGYKELGALIGFWPSSKIVSNYKAKNCDFTVFTINDKFLMKLYLDAGFGAIGTDDPSLLISTINEWKDDFL